MPPLVLQAWLNSAMLTIRLIHHCQSLEKKNGYINFAHLFLNCLMGKRFANLLTEAMPAIPMFQKVSVTHQLPSSLEALMFRPKRYCMEMGKFWLCTSLPSNLKMFSNLWIKITDHVCRWNMICAYISDSSPIWTVGVWRVYLFGRHDREGCNGFQCLYPDNKDIACWLYIFHGSYPWLSLSARPVVLWTCSKGWLSPVIPWENTILCSY